MVLKQDKTADYYKEGSRDNIVISNSFLSALNPEQGGSPQKALSFFDKQTELYESKGIENGKTIHAYAEKPDQFSIATVPKPDATMGQLAEEFYRITKTQEVSTVTALATMSTAIVSKLKTPGANSAEMLEIQRAYEKLSQAIGVAEEPLIRLFRVARSNVNAYKTYGEHTVVNKFVVEAVDYVKQLHELQDKIALTVADEEMIKKVIKALKGNPLANKYYNLGGDFDTNIIFKEWDIYYELTGYKAKSRLDNIYVDFDNLIIYLNDLKTTAKPLALFQNTVEAYRYYRQITLYKIALVKAIKQKLLGNSIYLDYDKLAKCSIVTQIIAVETTGNFECCVFNMDDYLAKGTKELQSLMTRYDFHVKNNVWNMSMEQVQGGGVVRLKPVDNVINQIPDTQSA